MLRPGAMRITSQVWSFFHTGQGIRCSGSLMGYDPIWGHVRRRWRMGTIYIPLGLADDRAIISGTFAHFLWLSVYLTINHCGLTIAGSQVQFQKDLGLASLPNSESIPGRVYLFLAICLLKPQCIVSRDHLPSGP